MKTKICCSLMIMSTLLGFVACNNGLDIAWNESYKWQIIDYKSLSWDAKSNYSNIGDSLAEANAKIYDIQGIILDVNSLCSAKMQIIPLEEKTLQLKLINRMGNKMWWGNADALLHIERDSDRISGSIKTGESEYLVATLLSSECVLVKYKSRPPVERPNPPIEDTQLAGHWRNYYYYDGKFRIASSDEEYQLWLEADSSFQYFKEGVVLDKGTWSVGHTERYYEMDHNAYHFKDSIVFVGQTNRIIRYFEYPSAQDGYRLPMIKYTPGEWCYICGDSPRYWERMEQ